MGKQNYFVSIFVDGKNVGSHYSEDLTELVTVKAMYKGCELDILDMNTFQHLSEYEVRQKVNESVRSWKMALAVKPVVEEKAEPQYVHRPKGKDVWKRAVMCVETKQVFQSIRECSEKIGIPYMTIANCIKNGNATRGVHFINIKKEIIDDGGKK